MTRIATWTIRASANACSRGIPIACPTATAANSNVPRFDGPAGTAAASATPEAISAAWPIDSWSAIDWPTAAIARIAHDHETALQANASTSVRGRPATAKPVLEPPPELLDPRPALDRARGGGRRPGRRWATIPIARTTTNSPATAGADEDRARDDAADVQDEQRDRRDRDTTTRSTTRSTTTVPSADVRLIPSRSPR